MILQHIENTLVQGLACCLPRPLKKVVSIWISFGYQDKGCVADKGVPGQVM